MVARKTKTVEIDGLGELELRIPSRDRFANIDRRFPKAHQLSKRVAVLIQTSTSREDFERLGFFWRNNPDRVEDSLAFLMREIGTGVVPMGEEGSR